MRKSSLHVTSIIVLIMSFFLFNACKVDNNKNVYLQKVLSKLDKIKSATYFATSSASFPGDTMSFSEPRTLFFIEFVTPSDTFVGASYMQYKKEDTTKIESFYDGVVKGEFNWDKQTIKIDSFQNYPYPFRLVYMPFYTKTASIINYALETKDSIKTSIKDFGDSVRFSLFIYDKVLEFVTKPFNDVHQGESSIGKISQYDIWIRKSDNLPFRMRRKMSHQTSFETCTDVKLNTIQDTNFISRNCFPVNFSIIQFKREKRNQKSELEGKTAPNWTLKDIDGNTISLKNLTSKVLMIQFTGVGCGPCHQSLPFVKQLVSDYRNKNFEFVSIETWSKNIEGLKRYQEKNDFNFKFLKTEESVTKDYEINSVPVFFILDENRVIRKVIFGYSKDVTDTEILNAINKLI